MNLKEFGIEKDKNDILKSFKSRFVNNPNEIYLDGNSLGKLPKTSYSEISELVKNQWGSKLISSWNDHWLKLCLLYTSPSPRDGLLSRMPSSA